MSDRAENMQRFLARARDVGNRSETMQKVMDLWGTPREDNIDHLLPTHDYIIVQVNQGDQETWYTTCAEVNLELNIVSLIYEDESLFGVPVAVYDLRTGKRIPWTIALGIRKDEGIDEL